MKVGIVGLGYVGLPLAMELAAAGMNVVGYDTDSQKVAALASGRSYIEDVSESTLLAALPRFWPTTDSAELRECEVVVVCVPTPLTATREPDLAPLRAAAECLARVVRKDQLIVLESTTYPGCTRDLLVPILEESGLRAGLSFHVAFSPERVDPGRTDHTLRTTPKIVAGLTPECQRRAVDFYSAVCDEVVEVSTLESAELSKLLENTFRAVNIALVNEVAIFAGRLGIDIWEVVDAAATKPYGFMRFDPGPGMGGHCLPIDPFYLSWRARFFDVQAEFIELAGKVNQQMPYHCLNLIVRSLNARRKAVNGATVGLLGVSYKPGVGDTRESPGVKLAELLRDLGAEVRYHDPFVPALPSLNMSNTPIEEAVIGADVVVLATAHPDVDYKSVLDMAELVVDLRGTTRKIPNSGRAEVVCL